MSRPRRDVVLPATLASQGIRNGKLPDHLLLDIGHNARLHERAAVSFVMMRQACLAATGVEIIAAGANAYRTYAEQERIFLARYTMNRHIAARPYETRSWRGELWYRLPNVATAAIPGTSNHGLGLAIDVNYRTPGVMDWLVGDSYRALDYGWSWELDSEPWHLRYFMGDDNPFALPAPPSVITIPPIVAGNEQDDMTLIKATHTNLDGSPGWNGYIIEWHPITSRHVAVYVAGPQWEVLARNGTRVIECTEAELIAGFDRVGIS